MARALALIQLLLISVGAFIIHLLVKVHDGMPSTDPLGYLSVFLARHALWLFAIPILYAAVGAIFLRTREKVVTVVGVALTMLILILLGVSICYHLF